MFDDLVNSLTDRLTTTTDTDMSYMNQHNDSIDWEYTPFHRTAKLKSKSSTSIEKVVERGATRLYDELTHSRDDELQDVSLSWFDVDEQGVGYSPNGLYFFEIGPTVATAPGVTWDSAFTLDTETAPEFKSDAWKEVASRFNFSDRDEREGIPSKVLSMYSALEKLTKRNEHTRAVHPKELRTYGPHVKDRAFEIAIDSLATFDGVHGPTDGPAWIYTEPESVATDSTGEAVEPGESTA